MDRKGALILPLGFGIFRGLRAFSEATLVAWGREIAIEPLMVCMIASMIAGNSTGKRHQFANILEKAAPYIFLPFFTLTGASLQLDKVIVALPLALAVVALRMTSIFVSLLAEEKMHCRQHHRDICCAPCCWHRQHQRTNTKEDGSTSDTSHRMMRNGVSEREEDWDNGSSPLSEASTRAPIQSPGRLDLGQPLMSGTETTIGVDIGVGKERLRLSLLQELQQEQSSAAATTSSDLGTELLKSTRDQWFWIGCTMMSQAGVALGLAFETESRFKRWGSNFSTLVLSIVVLNQILGPPLCKIGFVMLGAGDETTTIDIDIGHGENENGDRKKTDSFIGRDDEIDQEGRRSTSITVDVMTAASSSASSPTAAPTTSSSSIKVLGDGAHRDDDEDVLLRALSSPGTRIRVMMRHPSSEASLSPYRSTPLSSSVTSQVGGEKPMRTASAYNMLGPQRSTSASVSSSNVAMEDQVTDLELRSPGSLVLLSRSPSRGLARDISALRGRREARKISSENGGSRKNM